MAPITATARTEKERRLASLICKYNHQGLARANELYPAAFAEQLQSRLSEPRASTVPSTEYKELEDYVVSFPPNIATIAASRCEELDSSGTALWNLCTRLKRGAKTEALPTWPLTILMARVFAFWLIDCAHNSAKGSYSNLLRLMKVGLKTSKICIDQKRLDYASKVLEKCAMYEERLNGTTTDITPEDTEIYDRLASEYYAIRILMAWRQDQLEVAEHMFSKASSARQLNPEAAENLSDILFEVGKDLLAKKHFEIAVKWLKRSYDVLTCQELDPLSSDGLELRTSILQCTVKALLALETSDGAEEASNLINMLESEVGDKLIVLLMRLELLSSPSNDMFDSDAYSGILRKMIRTAVLSETNFKLLMHHIHNLNDKSPALACDRLDELLSARVLQADRIEWVETVLISRISMASNQRDSVESKDAIQSILDIAASNLTVSLSLSAIHAAQTLLWKRIESNYTQGQFRAAGEWCRLALHPIFQHAGDLNMAKITRKLLLCTLARQEIGEAHEIFASMAETAKDEPLTRFLMYKIALQEADVDKAAECLEKIYEKSSDDATLLYACVLQAQQAGDKMIAVGALEMVLRKHENESPSTIHFPALIRCTIKLLVNELASDNESVLEPKRKLMIDQLCKLFDGAAVKAQRLHRTTNTEVLFTSTELDWFSKNAYNLALNHLEEWDQGQILCLIRICIKFVELYPADIDRQTANDILLRRIFCNFLATILLVAAARAEDNIEKQLQDYLEIRHHVKSYDTNLQDRLQSLETGPAEDLLKKLSMLLAYDFEAATRLKAWDDLSEIIIKATACKSTKIYEVMADCILSCEAPTNVVISNLKKIVNAAWSLGNVDVAKLSRYMRSLIQFALPQSDNIALDLLDQVQHFAGQARESSDPYPPEELEWVVTRSFNHGIDFYCSGDDSRFRTWCTRAITLASLCADHGSLQQLLETKFFDLLQEV